jgi:endoglycosylceramidase
VWWEPASTWNLTIPSHLGNPPLTPAITDPQIGFAFHDYCAFGELSTYLGLPAALQASCDLYHDLTWLNAATFEARTGLPQLVTEFGNIDDATELERSLRRSDATFTGWQYWHYGEGFAPRPESTEPFTPTQLQHLVRTYPRATAGVPGALSFDPASGEMRYRYAPRSLGAPTEIAVSDVHYPDGYAAEVSGGRATSASGASVLTIEADAAATQVDVVVRRAAPTPTPAPSTTALATDARALPATGAAPLAIGWALAGVGLALLRIRRTSSH